MSWIVALVFCSILAFILVKRVNGRLQLRFPPPTGRRVTARGRRRKGY
jgi:hypothetical protein